MANCNIHHAILALDDTLNLLLALQQHEPQSPILGPELDPSPKHEISTAFSTDRFRNAVRCLRDQQNLLLLEQFFDRIFASLYAQLEAYMNDSMNSLAPQLELICDIIHATYHLTIESRVDPQPQSHSLSDSIIQPMMNNLLVPIRTLLESMQERLVMDNVGRLPNFYQISSKCNEVLASILIAVMEAHDEGSGASIALGDPICLILSLYDEHLLPIFMSTDGSEPRMISGLLALMQHLKQLKHVDHIQRAMDELTARLCASGILRWSLKCLQTSKDTVDTATYHAFIITLIEFSGIFCSQDCSPDSVLQGDLIPEPAALLSLNVDSMAMDLHHETRSNDQIPSIPRERQRWILAFLYLDLRASKTRCEVRGLEQAILEIISNDRTLEHLYGSSWIQLLWIYVILNDKSQTCGVRTRPFTFSRLLHGLKISTREPEGWHSKKVLERCLNDILPWIWRGDWDQNKSELRNRLPNELLSELLLMWMMNEFPFEPQYEPKFIESDRMSNVIQKVLQFPSTLSSIRTTFSDVCRTIVSETARCDGGQAFHLLSILCSVIRLTANATFQGCDNFDGKTKSSFFEDVTAITWKYLQDRSTSCRALELLWMQLDSLLALTKTSDVSKSWVDWRNIPVDSSIVTQNILLQIEKIQNKSKANGKEAYQRMTFSIRLLLVVMQFSEGIDDIFDDEPQLPSLIWSFIQELMDELSTSEDDIQISCDALSIQESLPLKVTMEAIAVHGMLLLCRAHDQHLQDYPVFKISSNDLALMIHYSLVLHDRQRGQSAASEAERCGLTRLVMELVQIVAGYISQGNRADDAIVQGIDLHKYFDLLLDAMRDDFILKNSDEETWSTLSKFHAILRILDVTNLSQALPPAIASDCTPEQPACTLNREILSKLGRHPGHIVMTKRLLQRWVIEASDFLQSHKAQAPSQQALTCHSATEDQEENCGLDDERTERLQNGGFLEADRICQSIVDILAIIKLTTADSFHASGTIDGEVVGLLECRAFSKVSEMILSLQQHISHEHRGSLNQIQNAIEFLKWLQHSYSDYGKRC